MEAHSFLSKRGFDVHSYGTGSQVKLPGGRADEPNIYSFDTKYEDMYYDLTRKDRHLYTQNGVLHMLDRNRRIKSKPERFQTTNKQFDVIICVEERIYDTVVEHLENDDSQEGTRPVHIINIDIQDNHEEATLGAFLICDLVTMISDSDDLDNDIDDIILAFSKHCNRALLHTVCFY